MATRVKTQPAVQPARAAGQCPASYRKWMAVAIPATASAADARAAAPYRGPPIVVWPSWLIALPVRVYDGGE